MKGIEHKSDDDLLSLLQSNHSWAFEELYKRYWAKLYSSAYKRLKQKEASEEVVQDFFASIWLNRSKLVINTSFNIYAHISIKFLVFKVFRKEYVRKRHLYLNEQVLSNNPTEQSITIKELKQAVKDEVDALPEKCRNVYELSRDQFKNNKEIACILGISEKTVENHLTRALKSLRLSIKDVISIAIIVLANNF